MISRPTLWLRNPNFRHIWSHILTDYKHINAVTIQTFASEEEKLINKGNYYQVSSVMWLYERCGSFFPRVTSITSQPNNFCRCLCCCNCSLCSGSSRHSNSNGMVSILCHWSRPSTLVICDIRRTLCRKMFKWHNFRSIMLPLLWMVLLKIMLSYKLVTN